MKNKVFTAFLSLAALLTFGWGAAFLIGVFFTAAGLVAAFFTGALFTAIGWGAAFFTGAFFTATGLTAAFTADALLAGFGLGAVLGFVVFFTWIFFPFFAADALVCFAAMIDPSVLFQFLE
ncbi:MAG TPA: hypothetical protein PK961_00345 [bacterium]|nr:hypothetical protein [bacterium]